MKKSPIKNFFREGANELKEFLTAPVSTWRDSDSVEGKVFSFLLGCAMYVVAPIAISHVALDAVKNPQYTFLDKDPASGKETTVKVTPSKGLVLHRLGDDFDKVADFRANKFQTVVGEDCGCDKPPVVTSQTIDAARKTQDSVGIGKMEKYLGQAEAAYKSRALRFFN